MSDAICTRTGLVRTCHHPHHTLSSSLPQHHPTRLPKSSKAPPWIRRVLWWLLIISLPSPPRSSVTARSILRFVHSFHHTHYYSIIISPLSVLAAPFKAAEMAPFLLFTFVTLLVSFLVSPTGAVRAHDRRSDLKGIPPVSELGWTVPLAGGNSCVPNIGCKRLDRQKRDI